MQNPDAYTSYQHLARNELEGRDYRIHLTRRSSPLAVVAPHAGGIEPGTGELAAALAGDVHSLYVFEGLKQVGSAVLHITSTRFDEPRCLELIQSAETVLTVHGCAGQEPAVYTGGLDRHLRYAIIRNLSAAGFHARVDIPQRGGSHPANLCNRGRRQRGVQLEITEGLRSRLFASLDRSGRRFKTAAFFQFVTTLQQTLTHQQRSQEDTTHE